MRNLREFSKHNCTLDYFFTTPVNGESPLLNNTQLYKIFFSTLFNERSQVFTTQLYSRLLFFYPNKWGISATLQDTTVHQTLFLPPFNKESPWLYNIQLYIRLFFLPHSMRDLLDLTKHNCTFGFFSTYAIGNLYKIQLYRSPFFATPCNKESPRLFLIISYEL